MSTCTSVPATWAWDTTVLTHSGKDQFWVINDQSRVAKLLQSVKAHGGGMTTLLAAMRQPAATGFVGWLLSKQALFYRELSGLIRAASYLRAKAGTLSGSRALSSARRACRSAPAGKAALTMDSFSSRTPSSTSSRRYGRV